MFSNILIGILVIGVTVIIHALGTKVWVNFLAAKYHTDSDDTFRKQSVRILIYTALFLLSLNFLEAIIWGVTYYILPGITELATLEESVYFSLVTYTTLGYGDITIKSSNRILAGFEAMNGILLLGWSTTLMYSVVQTVLKSTFDQKLSK